MALSPRLFALVGGLGGGCGIVPLILFHQNSNNLNTPSSKKIVSSSPSLIFSPPEKPPVIPPPDSKQATPPLVIKKESQGNCKVIEIKGELEEILWQSFELNEDYVGFICKNSDTDLKIPSDWTGLFPYQLLANGQKLTIEDKFDIKTNTELVSEGNYKTIFSGSGIVKTSLAGEWSEPVSTEGDKTVITVNISESSKKIYLTFKELSKN